MPLGEFFSCVWLVLLALNLMTSFPRCYYCSSYSTTTHSLTSLSSSSSSENLPSQPEQNSATAAAISNNHLCHHSIDTSELISADCQQMQQKQKEPRMRITGEISEGPGPPSCPASCSHNSRGRKESARSEKNSSCYRYLLLKDCEDSWQTDWSSIRLRHCCEHSVRDTVPKADEFLNNRQQCERHVNELLELDAFVAKVTCQFEQVLLRYDCQQNYSVNNCEKCRVAYRRWVCASLIPHWRERHKVKPCRSICHAVEQTCPWLLPADKVPGYPAQYAGEPIFQCIDEHIPETGEQLIRSTYGSGCCYEYCEQLRYNEILTGSYHQSKKSHLSSKHTVFCIQGCNDSTSDPSQGTKTGLLAPCNNKNSPSSTSSSEVPTIKNSASQSHTDGATIPFVNFPLSSCPSSETDSTSNTQNFRANSKTFFNLLIFWFVFYSFLLITN